MTKRMTKEQIEETLRAFDLRDAVFVRYPEGTTWGAIMDDLEQRYPDLSRKEAIYQLLHDAQPLN